METKTIGKFISALRRAAGMTQKELGERLFVSDKTVSRWERDECTPELALIPAIADIFGVTADELIRGERRTREREEEGRPAGRREKSWRLVLDKHIKKYKSLSMIAVGLSFLGILAVMAINLGFQRGMLAFCVGTACLLASEICLVCFASNARLPVEEEEEGAELTKDTNRRIKQNAFRISLFNMALFLACLPVVVLTEGGAYVGLAAGSWAVCCLILLSLLAFILYTAWLFGGQKKLSEADIFPMSPEAEEKNRADRRRFLKTGAVCLSVLLVLGVGVWAVQVFFSPRSFVEQHMFTDAEELKAFLEADYDAYLAEEKRKYPWDEEMGDWFPNRKNVEIYDAAGNLLAECYANPDLYAEWYHVRRTWEIELPGTLVVYQGDPSVSVDWNLEGDGGVLEIELPITLMYQKEVHEAYSLQEGIVTCLYLAIFADVLVCAAVYAVKTRHAHKNK